MPDREDALIRSTTAANDGPTRADAVSPATASHRRIERRACWPAGSASGQAGVSGELHARQHLHGCCWSRVRVGACPVSPTLGRFGPGPGPGLTICRPAASRIGPTPSARIPRRGLFPAASAFPIRRNRARSPVLLVWARGSVSLHSPPPYHTISWHALLPWWCNTPLRPPDMPSTPMNAADAASPHSSSSLSPPQSPPSDDNIRVASAPHPGFHLEEAVANAHHLHHRSPAATPDLHQHASTAAAPHAPGAASTSTFASAVVAPDKQKRPRKKKDPAAALDGKSLDDGKPKERKPRKPRESKDKTATPTPATMAATTATTTTTTITAPRKRVKTEPKSGQEPASRQPTITEMVNTYSAPPSSTPFSIPSAPPRPPPFIPAVTATNPVSNPPPTTTTTTTIINGISALNTLPVPTAGTPTPRPASSGQKYDPIRGYDPVRSITTDSLHSRPVMPASVPPSPHVNRASASPSLASLLEPPLPHASLPATTPASTAPLQSILQQPFVPTPSLPLQPPRPAPVPPTPQSSQPPSSFSASVTDPTTKRVDVATVDGAMDIDLTCDALNPPSEAKVPSKSSSGALTPKAARPTPPPAPKGTGSGLLSSSDLFGGPSSNGDAKRKGVDIDFRIPLNPDGGNTINIAQEILKRYGRDAINPRVAAHREELLRVAAEANKLDNGLNDDMSLDEMSEPENDSNVEMGGMEDEKSATSPDHKPVRKRRKKVEEYDKEDDFIDDTELAWQERAAVAKDGFFVYSGPLVPVGQDAQVETSTSTRGGRGRGRGRGSRGGATTAGATHASVAAAKKATAAGSANATTTNSDDPPARARGRGRGSGAPRKPRITKADRERMESEKLDRAKAAGLAGPAGGGGGGGGGALALTSTPLSVSTTSHMAETYPQAMGSTAG
nr:histone promoter control protein 2 [Quercus suber]